MRFIYYRQVTTDYNNSNSFELSLLQGVQPVGIPTFLLFFDKFLLLSYFLLLFLLFEQIPTFITFSNKDNNFVK